MSNILRDSYIQFRNAHFDFFHEWWSFAKQDPSMMVCMEQAFWDFMISKMEDVAKKQLKGGNRER